MWKAVYRYIISTIVVGIPNMPSKHRRNRINSDDRHDDVRGYWHGGGNREV